MTGTIQTFFTKRKFEFIRLDDGQEIFFHQINFEKGTPVLGQRVTFELGDPAKLGLPPQAINIEVAGSATSATTSSEVAQ